MILMTEPVSNFTWEGNNNYKERMDESPLRQFDTVDSECVCPNKNIGQKFH